MRDARFPLIMRASRIHDVLGCSPDEAMRLAKEEREANERDEAIDMLNEIAKASGITALAPRNQWRGLRSTSR